MVSLAILARCPATGSLGLAVVSADAAIGARASHARAEAGAVVTLAASDPRLGARGLALIAEGASAQQALDVLVDTSSHIRERQLALIDVDGTTAVFSGERTGDVHAEAEGDGMVALGHGLVAADVPEVVIEAFAAAPGAFADRLVAGLRAGVDAGGTAAPLRSAALLVVRDVPWPLVDLRIDWDEACPVASLTALWRRCAPFAATAVTRALDPSAAIADPVQG